MNHLQKWGVLIRLILFCRNTITISVGTDRPAQTVKSNQGLQSLPFSLQLFGNPKQEFHGMWILSCQRFVTEQS